MSTLIDPGTIDISQADSDDLIIHSYPRHSAYRLSGQIPPTVGDIALCGWVKKDPRHLGGGAGPRCVVCADLDWR